MVYVLGVLVVFLIVVRVMLLLVRVGVLGGVFLLVKSDCPKHWSEVGLPSDWCVWLGRFCYGSGHDCSRCKAVPVALECERFGAKRRERTVRRSCRRRRKPVGYE